MPGGATAVGGGCSDREQYGPQFSDCSLTFGIVNAMPMSLKAMIAQARRKLRRIEEDEAGFRVRIKGFSETEQTAALRWYKGIVKRQREFVRKLENSN
jgi:hypothetical protein